MHLKHFGTYWKYFQNIRKGNEFMKKNSFLDAMFYGL